MHPQHSLTLNYAAVQHSLTLNYIVTIRDLTTWGFERIGWVGGEKHLGIKWPGEGGISPGRVVERAKRTLSKFVQFFNPAISSPPFQTSPRYGSRPAAPEDFSCAAPGSRV